MDFKTIKPGKSISLFVKDILVFEEQGKSGETILPFFADGYPGLMFQQAEKGLYVQPHNKKMPVLFLYGQTIHPIELHMKGSYKLIVFQVYPFVLKSFFNINAKDINDYCYDLEQLEDAKDLAGSLMKDKSSDKRIERMTEYLVNVFKTKKVRLDLEVKRAIQLIMESKGRETIKEITGKLPITARTFERRFLNEVGVSAKQFSQMIRFHNSLEQLALKEFTKLTDIVYSNGFADQSHFIRVFKAHTGKTPKTFLANQA